MFTNEDAKKKILVRILRSDGESLSGHLVVPMMSELTRVMNNDTKFLEFQDLSGAVRLVAKSSVLELQTQDLKSPDLKTPDAASTIDPFAILGLTRNCAWADVRRSYLEITKRYHPDQYANVSLPDEVVDYMSARFSQANTAYNLIKSTLSRVKEETEAA